MAGSAVEAVRENVSLINAGDYDAAFARWSDDAVLDWSESIGPDAGVYRGRDQAKALLRRFMEMFKEMRYELLEVAELEPGLVLAENVSYLSGRDGIETQARSAWLVWVAEGRIAHLRMFQSRQEALDAVAAMGARKTR